MNYGEELVYWYLRLNGFFPIVNYVIHKTEAIEFRSDFDLIAVRPPHVFEDVGGMPEDWDTYLTAHLDFNYYVGLLCEVKTGNFDEGSLFRREYLQTGVRRLGLVPETEVAEVVNTLSNNTGHPIGDIKKRICKLFISPEEHPNVNYLNLTIAQVENFIIDRITKYSDEKFASRMFFPSPMFQLLIAQVRKRATLTVP